jgi:methanogenic corrinoid protein MtbC1
LKNLKDKVKVIIDGAPLTESFAREIGADAYGKTRKPSDQPIPY